MNSVDFELAKKKDYYTLWKKYEALMMIYFKKLPENVRSYLFEDFKDFKDSCYQVLVNAVDALILSKIKNRDTWTFWQQFSFYLQNYTTRQCCRDTWHIWSGEVASTREDDSNYWQSTLEDFDSKVAIDTFYKSCNQNERDIVDMRMNGVPWYELYKKYGKKTVEELRTSLENKATKYIGD